MNKFSVSVSVIRQKKQMERERERELFTCLLFSGIYYMRCSDTPSTLLQSHILAFIAYRWRRDS